MYKEDISVECEQNNDNNPENATENERHIVLPEEFNKIIHDFVSDIKNTFPEYENIINKWWVNEDNREKEEEIVTNLFKHCLSVFPERFFDIIYKNNDIFAKESTINTEFLPGISFKYLWSCDISDKTRETMWKYLQLILLSIVGSVDNRNAFGDTSKLFDSINENDFKDKLKETLESMQTLFEPKYTTDASVELNIPDISSLDESEHSEESNNANPFSLPNPDNVHEHISGIMNGKLGKLAQEIAEETTRDLDFGFDMDNVTNVNDVFQSLLKNPSKLMSMVKSVGQKLDSHIKSGDIKENEIFSEATDIMNKMKNMPGMDNIQNMISKLGGGLGGGMGGGLGAGAEENKPVNKNKNTQMRERMKKNLELKVIQQELQKQMQNQQSQIKMSDDELINYFNDDKTCNKETLAKNNGKKDNGVGKKKK